VKPNSWVFITDWLSRILPHSLGSNGAYYSIDFPLASDTFAFGINDTDEIVGYYQAGSDTHGLVYSDGFNQVDVPGGLGTILYGINNKGEVVGEVEDVLQQSHGIIGQ
jgi:hypothetical protein